MDENALERLLQQVVELERMESGWSTHAVGIRSASTRGASRVTPVRPARPEGRWVWRVSATAAAAAVILLVSWRWPTDNRRASPHDQDIAAVPVELVSENEIGADRANAEMRRFSACAEHDAYALVLLREWRAECQCLSWTLQQLETGAHLMRLLAGQSAGIVVDVSGDPPVEQAVLVAVASRARDLPRDEAARERLLSCLNDALPPDLPGGASAEWARAVQGCLPQGVTVVQRPFVAK